MTEMIMTTASLLFAAAITPGPNNYLVLRAAMDEGVARAAVATSGVVAGSATMLLLAQSGLVMLFDQYGWARHAIAFAAGGYLVWLGIRQIRDGIRGTPLANSGRGGIRGFRRMAAFQFLNPKAWVLVLTIAAATPDEPVPPGPVLLAKIITLIAVTSICLAAWVALGRLASELVQDHRARRGFDAAMGTLLVASSVTLVAHF